MALKGLSYWGRKYRVVIKLLRISEEHIFLRMIVSVTIVHQIVYR